MIKKWWHLWGQGKQVQPKQPITQYCQNWKKFSRLFFDLLAFWPLHGGGLSTKLCRTHFFSGCEIKERALKAEAAATMKRESGKNLLSESRRGSPLHHSLSFQRSLFYFAAPEKYLLKAGAAKGATPLFIVAAASAFSALSFILQNGARRPQY